MDYHEPPDDHLRLREVQRAANELDAKDAEIARYRELAAKTHNANMATNDEAAKLHLLIDELHARAEQAEAAERIQELKAERDAMQARVDGWQDITTAPKDGTWFVAAQNGETYPCEWRVEEPDEGAGKAGWWDHFNQSFEEPTHWMPTASAEPAPDPDLVLAREAAESLGLVDTATKMIAESVALRALKLAKERG